MCACRKAVLLDGGFSTQLTRHVKDPVDGHPLWSARFLATDPEAVRQVHLDFLRAGAEVIITNTYQASVGGFGEHMGLDEQESLALMKTAVDLAKQAVDLYMEENPSCKSRPLVAGSVGPYGASLHDGSEYRGEYVERVSKQEMADWHRPRIATLVEAGVDLLALETIPAQAEAEMLVELIKEFPNTKAWITFSCKEPAEDDVGSRLCGGASQMQDYHHTSHGEQVEDAARLCWSLNPQQLIAVGFNCLNPKFVSSLLSCVNASGHDRIPLIVYPNSGEIYSPKTGWTDADKAVAVDTYVEEWLSLGVEYVGGCCRTNAEDILRMRAHLDRWLKEGSKGEPVSKTQPETNIQCTVTNGVGCH